MPVVANFPSRPGDTAPLPRAAGPVPPANSADTAGTWRDRGVKGIGLLAVAVVSGLVWYLVRHQDAAHVQATRPPATAGEFRFQQAEGPVVSTDCAANSYGRTKDFFDGHPCRRVVRALYTTTSGDKRALVSVVVVQMPDDGQARQLKALTDRNQTGNVNDLVKDHTTKIPGAPEVYLARYDSRVTGADVTIVMADFFAGRKDDPLLTGITTDALRLGESLRRA